MIHVRRTYIDIDSDMIDHYVSEHVYAFLRGDVLVITFNTDWPDALNVPGDLEVPFTWSSKDTVCNLLESRTCCECLSVKDFASQFKKNSGKWTMDGLPQVWAPPHPFETNEFGIWRYRWFLSVGALLWMIILCLCLLNTCKRRPAGSRQAELLPLTSERSDMSVSGLIRPRFESWEDDPQIICRLRPCCGTKKTNWFF